MQVKKFLKVILYSFVLFLCAVFVLRSIYSAGLMHEPKKSGTDGAGYAILSKQIRKDKVLNKLTASPKPSKLETIVIQVARDSKESHKKWETGLAPNSFRYNPSLSRNISQYPLGTSYLMSFFPRQLEVRALLIACVVGSTLIFSYLVVNAWESPVGLRAVILLSWLICLWLCREYLSHSFSMFPTVVLSLICGLVSMKASWFDNLSPTVAGTNIRITGQNTFIGLGLMLGLSLWFRTSNILLGPPIVASLLFAPVTLIRRRRQVNGRPAILERLQTLWHARRLLLRKFLPMATGFVVGLTPLLTSNLIIGGNMLFTNYPSYDRETVSSIWSVYGNLETLFLRGGPDSLLLVLTVVVLTICEMRSRSIGYMYASDYWKLAVIILVCSALVISLKIVIASYYVSCVAFFYLAHGLTWLVDSLTYRKRNGPLSGVICGLVLVVSVITIGPYIPSLSRVVNNTITQEEIPLLESLRSEDIVVWSDEESGYLYYRFGILGLRHSRMSSELSQSIMCRLNRDGYKQYLEGQIGQRHLPGDHKLYNLGKPIINGAIEVREIISKDSLCPG